MHCFSAWNLVWWGSSLADSERFGFFGNNKNGSLWGAPVIVVFFDFSACKGGLFGFFDANPQLADYSERSGDFCAFFTVQHDYRGTFSGRSGDALLYTGLCEKLLPFSCFNFPFGDDFSEKSQTSVHFCPVAAADSQYPYNIGRFLHCIGNVVYLRGIFW